MPVGVWASYFEPLENVALYEAYRSGAVQWRPDDAAAEAAACGDVDCEAPRTCRLPDTVVSKRLEWRHFVHRKALWAVRAWYYGPKKRGALPRNLSYSAASGGLPTPRETKRPPHPAR